MTTATVNVQTIQADALFTGKVETRFNNWPRGSYKVRKSRKRHRRRNMATLGLIVSRLKDEGGLPTKVSSPVCSACWCDC